MGKILFILSFFIITLILSARPYTIKYISLAALGILIYFGFSLIIFYTVLKKFKFPTNPYHAKIYGNAQFMDRDQSEEISEKDKDVEMQTVALKDILESRHLFNLFARHLTREWCLENLLFFVETQQWLKSLSTN